ncbi:MAG: Ig-like domain repeat protein [Nocardioides sp.]|nr:Ig-like domain repeat protein [Nocardioides sp.]
MNLRRISTRVAVAGVSTAIAAGGLVAATGVAANAETVVNTYTCSNAAVGITKDFDLTVDGAIPVPQYWAGAAVPGGLLNVTASAPVDAETAALLAGAGVTGAKSDDFAFDLGGVEVPVPVSGDFTSGDAGTSWSAAGSNLAFVTPQPGTYDALMPAAFTMTLMQGANPSIPLDCVLKEGTDPGAITSGFTLLQQSSAMTAPKTAVAKLGKPAKVTVNLKSTSMGNSLKGATIVAKEGSKKLTSGKTDKQGNVTLNLGKKLKLGKHTIKFSYAGTPSMKASSATTKLTVKK